MQNSLWNCSQTWSWALFKTPFRLLTMGTYSVLYILNNENMLYNWFSTWKQSFVCRKKKKSVAFLNGITIQTNFKSLKFKTVLFTNPDWWIISYWRNFSGLMELPPMHSYVGSHLFWRAAWYLWSQSYFQKKHGCNRCFYCKYLYFQLCLS